MSHLGGVFKVKLRSVWRGGVLFLLVPVLMMAWGPIGHMTVAAVAYEKLTLAVKARVAVLLKLNPDYASWDKQVPPGATPEEHDRDIFIMAAVWADDIKGESQYSDDGTAGGMSRAARTQR